MELIQLPTNTTCYLMPIISQRIMYNQINICHWQDKSTTKLKPIKIVHKQASPSTQQAASHGEQLPTRNHISTQHNKWIKKNTVRIAQHACLMPMLRIDISGSNKRRVI